MKMVIVLSLLKSLLPQLLIKILSAHHGKMENALNAHLEHSLTTKEDANKLVLNVRTILNKMENA